MTKRKEGRKFNRKTGQRRAFLRSLTVNVIRKERIVTTEARAREIRSLVERAVTIAKKETLAGRRLLAARLHDPVAVKKLFEDIAPRYKGRNGGYTRIIKSGAARKRDGVRTATIEFI
ncbi:MAG: 50S ribosomal protein L17 [Candidatus Liptonbacteria bacterium RIFCSPHIGHO2_01_FULL_57_28]|uniref:Large ribosomal subunit protein bL17 n=1 Tax=Candidatus Liptonbacteria bacterium RIFCSPHIGHO2_01_FULL_57_28 TaxID=1798647 RepID=A0A1G2CAB3_9BACT|nr:MAG: 50S ribosomal protein L17 [Candidatus Liptonbacteria bacterium RIFCSPHIGHO2_01_FULL_57_28]